MSPAKSASHDRPADGPKLRRRLLPFERNFTQIPNSWLRDGRLSWKARGLLAMLMTHDDGFSTTLVSITNASPRVNGEGRDGMRDAVNELEQHGYLRRHPITRRGRFIGDDWEICDPSGVNDATLFGLVDNSPVPASSTASRRATASSTASRYRVVNGDAYKNTPAKNSGERPQGALPGASDDPVDLWKTCPRSRDGIHEFDSPEGWCIHCAQVRRDGSLFDRHGEPIPPVTPKTSEEDGHAVAS